MGGAWEAPGGNAGQESAGGEGRMERAGETNLISSLSEPDTTSRLWPWIPQVV